MDLLKVATTKSKYLNVMLTVTETLTASVIVFYIYFLINTVTLKNKRQLDAIACYSNFSFFGFTPTIDIEPIIKEKE